MRKGFNDQSPRSINKWTLRDFYTFRTSNDLARPVAGILTASRRSLQAHFSLERVEAGGN
jgi:hypothetical protein